MSRLGIFVLVALLSHSAQAASVKVMSFNILLGGAHHYPLDTTAEVIRRAGADVVGVQEADGNGAELSRRLGFHWHPVARGTRPGGIASRHPFSRTFRQGAEIALPTGEKLAVFSVHLRSNPYEPYGIKEGSLASEAAAIQSARTSREAELAEVLAELAPLVARGEPVFLVGDFNEPSHLDWTEAAGPAGAKLHAMKVRWPTSSAVAASGLRDAYRAVHPDEVKKPGYTWTPFSSPGELHDRIDFIHFAGSSVTVESVQIVGEKGGPDVDLVGHIPYPSDHRGVVGQFRLPPKARQGEGR